MSATLVVDFGSSADSSAFVAVELDETLNLDSEGQEKTQFFPGDEVWFWVQHDPTLRIDRTAATSGMVVACGTVQRSRKQELTFIGEEAVDLSYIADRIPALTWYGNEGAQFQVAGRSASVAGNTPCTCDAVLPITVHLYRFVPPPLELAAAATYRVVIVISMEAA